MEICKTLVEKNGNFNQSENKGQSPLQVAAQNGHTNVFTLLLENNEKVHQQINRAVSPLWIAAQSGFFHVCTLLLKNNAQGNLKSNDGVSPLWIAAYNGHVDLCTLLLENNPKVNQQRNVGASPLWVVSQNGHINICALLLENNADANQQNNDGVSRLEITAANGHVHVCNLLIKNKAHPNQKIQDFLDIAAVFSKQNVFTLFNVYQNSKSVDKEVEEARKKIKILEIKLIIEIKRESIAIMTEKNVRIYGLKQSQLTKQQEKDEIEKQVEFLNKQTSERMKLLKELKNEFSTVKLLLERQYTSAKPQ